MAGTPLWASQGCASLAGLEEPPAVEATSSSGTAGADGGGGGTGGSGGDGACGPGGIVEIARGQSAPRVIAVDGDNLYWLTTKDGGTGENAVWKMAKPSGRPTQLATTGTQRPIALAVDSTFVYWADAGDGSCNGAPDHDRIMKVERDPPGGPGAGSLVYAFCGEAEGVAVDLDTIYWARPGTSYVQSKGKEEPPSASAFIIDQDDLTQPTAIAVDGVNVYWTTLSGSSIRSSPKTTSMAAEFAESFENPRWLGLDASTVYWTTDTEVLKLAKGNGAMGATGESIFSELHDGAGGLAVDTDGDSVYVTSPLTGEVIKVPKDGSDSTVIASDQQNLAGIAVDECFVYWTDPLGGRILRAPK